MTPPLCLDTPTRGRVLGLTAVPRRATVGCVRDSRRGPARLGHPSRPAHRATTSIAVADVRPGGGPTPDAPRDCGPSLHPPPGSIDHSLNTPRARRPRLA